MVEPPAEIFIFDRALLRQRKARRAQTLHNHDFLFRWAAAELDERLVDIKHDFTNILHLGFLPPDTEWPAPDVGLCKINGGSHTLHLDEECLPFKDSSFDLILSTLNLHSINDLPGLLIQIRKALKPDGLFLGALPGGQTLHELRESLTHAELALKGGTSPRVFPFADKQQMGALLQRSNFALPVVDSQTLTVTYDDIFALMHDLRGMGQSNILRMRHKVNPGKALFFEAAQYYTTHFAEEDGRIRASFEIIFLIGWTPHKSQQKPLKPGSAKARLAEALNTKEQRYD